MTVPLAGAPPRRAARSSRWRRRWHRLAIPAAVLMLLVGVTWVARSMEEPDLSDAGTLSPTGTGPDGSSQLAAMLVERGVQIEPVADIRQAERALESGGDAVVFVPKSTFFGAILVRLATYRLADYRVVLVAPSAFEVGLTGLPVTAERPRWASADREPGCTVPEAVAAGRATALRGRYAVEDTSQVCYGGGLVRTGVAGAEVFVVGSTDPFRNRRIGEHGNAALATGLLAARDRVIWAGALPFEADFDIDADLNAPDRGERSRTRDCGFACMFDGYPQPVVVGLALAGLLALLLAFAFARRLGPPVSEPLPVVVPAAEAVAGRGRLYQRSRGRGVALTALRAAALHRIVPALGLPPAPPPDPETVVAAAAARTGLPPDHVRRTLYGPAPETDEDLANAVAALDALVAAVTRDRPQGDTR